MSIGTRLKARLSTTPYRFQVRGVRFAAGSAGRAGIFDDMGLGKTLQSLGWFAINERLAAPCVVVCPATLKLNWQEEFMKHARLKSEVLSGRKPYTPKEQIVIINYEILQYWVKKLRRRCRLLILDECQYVKNRGAKRTKACQKLAKTAEFILPLSGTPFDNRPVEFFPVLQMIDPGEFSSFWEYAFRYCGPKKGYGGSWDFRGASNLDELHERVAPYIIRRLKKDVLKDLPTKQRTVIPVEIDNRHEYEEARTDFLAWLRDTEGEKAAKRAAGAVTLVRLGKLKLLAAEGKLKQAIRWINDFLATGEKLVVFAVHKKILNALSEKFPKAALVTGSVKHKKRHAEVKRFQKRKNCRLFLGQLKAAGHGLTLTAASAMLILEVGWTAAIHDQAEDRILRIGQTASAVNIYYMVGQFTIEEWLLEIIEEKRLICNQVLDGVERSGGVTLNEMLKGL